LKITIIYKNAKQIGDVVLELQFYNADGIYGLEIITPIHFNLEDFSEEEREDLDFELKSILKNDSVYINCNVIDGTTDEPFNNIELFFKLLMEYKDFVIQKKIFFFDLVKKKLVEFNIDTGSISIIIDIIDYTTETVLIIKV